MSNKDGKSLDMPALAIDNVLMTTDSAYFTVTSSQPAPQDLFVDFESHGNNLSPDMSIIPTFTGTVKIPAGETTTIVHLERDNDEELNNDSQLSMALKNPKNAVIDETHSQSRFLQAEEISDLIENHEFDNVTEELYHILPEVPEEKLTKAAHSLLDGALEKSLAKASGME